jgi:hypothetical protein
MELMNNQMITPGEWIVSTTTVKDSPDRCWHICVMQSEAPHKIVGLFGVAGAPDADESMANASLLASQKEMLEALIAIQEAAEMPVIDRDAIRQLISDVFAKLANEAGVQ